MEQPKQIPDAKLEYAPRPPKKGRPWLAIISAPILGFAVFCLTLGALAATVAGRAAGPPGRRQSLGSRCPAGVRPPPGTG